MRLHQIQQKLLHIIDQVNVKNMSLRDIGLLIDESHPQKVRHHLSQLEKKGLIEVDVRTGETRTLNSKTIDKKGDILMVPVRGVADCGPANAFAADKIEGYLRLSRRLVGGLSHVFALRAQGPSMNKATVNGKHSIEEGDYVLINPDNKNPQNGDYVLSVIDGCANIKRFFWNREEDQIALKSESTENTAPIFIHSDDTYMINGVVVNVIKNSSFDELSQAESSSASDVLKSLGPISKNEVDYYESL